MPARRLSHRLSLFRYSCQALANAWKNELGGRNPVEGSWLSGVARYMELEYTTKREALAAGICEVARKRTKA
jgi:hypothetical protein